jgi:ABC-type branched-subunit amino acid transport system substrate-binding protein
MCPTPGGACQPLLSDDCQIVYGDYESDEAIPVGLMVSLTGPAQAASVLYTNPVELALEELEIRAIGLPGVGAERRPVVAVVCDEEADPVRAATFLAEQVKVPAIVGPLSSDNVLEVATSVTIDAGVLLVAPLAGAPGLRTLDDNGLVWHTIASIEADIRAQSEHLRQYVEPEVRSRFGLSMSDPIRVMVLARTDAVTVSAADAAVSTLVFNNQPALDNGDNFLRRDYDGTDTAAAIADALDFQPHVVIPYGQAEVFLTLLPEIDAALTEKPNYLLWGTAYSSPALGAFIAAEPSRQPRVTGTTLGALLGPVADTFSVAYSAKYDGDPSPLSAFVYDAAYSVMYALAAAGNVPDLTGAATATGMTKLVGGLPINVGGAGIDQALSILSSGGAIDVEGASGNLNFDTATGDVRPLVRIWCVNASLAFVITEQIYDDSSGTLSGVFSCP